MAVAQKILCRVNRIVDHGEHVYTVDLVPERKVPIFKPGQFLHLALDPYDPGDFWPESRVFSIASPLQQRNRISITYSVRGRFTARMERELTEGKTAWIKMPYGDFIIQTKGDVVLLAGGTGITAFTSFLSDTMIKNLHKFYLAYGVRNAQMLIYRNYIDQCVRNIDHFHLWYFIEEKPKGFSHNGSEIIGRLTINEIWDKIENPLETTYYLSGPPEMIHTLSRELKEHRIDPCAVRIDAWE
jgi:ferredoxin-NADP reductase